MKTILFIECGRSGYGGSFQSLYQTIKILNPAKYQSIVVFFNETLFYEKLRNEGIECYYLTDVICSNGGVFQKYLLGKINGFILRFLPRASIAAEYIIHFSAVKKLITLIRERKVDLIHLNNQPALNFLGLIAAKVANTPCVAHLRTFNSEGFNKYKVSYARRLNARFIAISKKIKEHWAGNGIEPERIEVIYNIFYPEERSDEKCIPLLTDYEGCKILFVGRIAECKGIPFLLDSFSELTKNNIEARLFFVGEGEDLQKIKKRVLMCKMDKDVFFLGYTDNPQAILQHADVVVLPSKEEGFGRVLLEAMNAGVPVIGTRIGGIPEIIEHNINGMLVDYGDAVGLRDAMLRVLNDRPLRDKLISNGYETVRTRFAPEGYKEKIEKVYDSL